MLPWAAGVAKLGQASPTGLIINPRYPRYHRPKFHAEFGVAKEEPQRPGEGLVQGLSQCRRYHVPRPLSILPP